MLHDKKISLIIPCRNEEAALHSMLQKIPSYIDEVIVIDNNSSDNTAVVAKQNGVRVVHEARQVDGVGYGFAHQTGMQYTDGDYVVAMDGDDTYPLETIKDLILYMEESQSDFVSCARLPLSNLQAISPIRLLGIRILNLEISLLYGYPIKDVLTGMWAMKKSCKEKLTVQNGGWNFSPEIKLAAIMHPEVHFSEYHIQHAHRLNGVSKLSIWKTGFDHLFYILTERFTTYSPFKKTSLSLIASTFYNSLKKVTALFF
jgi:glycosyltransferase involved in cell wall biosynthesis